MLMFDDAVQVVSTAKWMLHERFHNFDQQTWHTQQLQNAE